MHQRLPAEALLTAKLDAAGWRTMLQPVPAASAGDAVFAPRPAESASLLVVPARAMPFGFGSDPAYGCAPGRFAGYPVMSSAPSIWLCRCSRARGTEPSRALARDLSPGRPLEERRISCE